MSIKTAFRVLLMVLQPFPQFTGWVRAVVFLATLLALAGLIHFEPQLFLPTTWLGWCALMLVLAFLSLFTNAVYLQTKLDDFGGVTWHLVSARVDAREELKANPPEEKLRNVILCDVCFEVRNGSDQQMTLCPLDISIHWVPSGRWWPIKLELSNYRRHWGKQFGAHDGDYVLPPRSREEVWSSIRSQLPPEVFVKVKNTKLSARITFDVIGQAKRIETVPLTWRHA